MRNKKYTFDKTISDLTIEVTDKNGEQLPIATLLDRIIEIPDIPEDSNQLDSIMIFDSDGNPMDLSAIADYVIDSNRLKDL